MKKVLLILAFNKEWYRYSDLYLTKILYRDDYNNITFTSGDLLLKVSTRHGRRSQLMFHYEITIKYKDELVLFCKEFGYIDELPLGGYGRKRRLPPLRTFECFHKGEWINVINILHKSAKKSIKDWRLIQKKREKERKEKAFSPIDNE